MSYYSPTKNGCFTIFFTLSQKYHTFSQLNECKKKIHTQHSCHDRGINELAAQIKELEFPIKDLAAQIKELESYSQCL